VAVSGSGLLVREVAIVYLLLLIGGWLLWQSLLFDALKCISFKVLMHVFLQFLSKDDRADGSNFSLGGAFRE
jgi:hypothetical protein